ncbi:SDR family oxidoreductase [Leptobacterium sp. I13]|uniref:SDR family oxidoreductase n=1 Tax=Leptobacterium meishanense TaxID=3128904 RepID=UPI0030EF2570
MKNIVITGVSSGIGHAAAIKFLDEGNRVFGSVRNEKDVKKLVADYDEKFIPLIFDVTDEVAIQEAVKKVESYLEDGESIYCLINNAGYSVSGPIAYIPIDKLTKQFDVNVNGLVRVTQAFLPMLGFNNSRKKGKIINISSASGKITRPFMTPYSASKHAVEAISDGLRRELMEYGIDVIVVEPGPIQSKIWKKARSIDITYENTPYHKIYANIDKAVDEMEGMAIPAERLADLLYKIANRPKNRTRYLITPKKTAFWLAIHILPDRYLDKMFAKQLNKLKED